MNFAPKNRNKIKFNAENCVGLLIYFGVDHLPLILEYVGTRYSKKMRNSDLLPITVAAPCSPFRFSLSAKGAHFAQ